MTPNSLSTFVNNPDNGDDIVLRNPLWSRLLQLWAQADPNATARRQNQVLLSVSNVQKSVMYVWNWLATHCLAGWCCMEREITKISSPNNSKWSRAWRDTLQISEIKRCYDNLDLPDSDLWSVDGSLRSVMCLCCDCNSSCHGRSGQKHVESKKEPRRSQRNRTRSWKHAWRLANIIQHSEVQN